MQFETLETATFLKRNFVPYKTGGIAAPIAIESILNPLFFFQRSATSYIGKDRPNMTIDEIVSQCWGSQCRELFLHGHRTFAFYTDIMRTAAQRADMRIKLPSYDEVSRQMNELKCNPVDSWVDHDQAVRFANNIRAEIRERDVRTLKREIEEYNEEEYHDLPIELRRDPASYEDYSLAYFSTKYPW